ncbi:T9SS type A sorting domain-containing protein [Kaistella palustris]|uniref:T9SS type A sorting domain-containing protein n=1 Tax=Kaistella palustris TaxID=493376 RepID=UPI000400A9C9|nr:T9SS type A sorting domain-containing protein [Kaistella palustris]
MKKQFLLLLSLCSTLAFAQSNRSTDVNRTATPKKNVVVTQKLPEKPTVSTKAYMDIFNSQNLINPKLYKQELDQTSGVSSQEFETGNAAYSAMAADDFEVPAGATWNITDVYVSGTSYNSNYPTSFKVTFYNNSGTNLPGTAIRTDNVVLTAGSISPTIPLPTPMVLPPGKYWMSVQAVMDYTVGGQWYWNTYTATSTLGASYAWMNPGGGFGTTCTGWNTGTVCVPTTLKDLQFSLNGTTAGICKTFTGRVSTSDPTQSPRVSRNGVASTCATPKTYPGDISSGNFHYKTHSITNTSGSAECVTFNLDNTDPDALNQLFLVAYNGSFNPANVGQNYIGDSGSSASGGLPVSMSATIPAGATVVLVLSEVTANSVFTADYTLDVVAANCGAILKVGDISGKQSVALYPNPVNQTLHVNGMNVKSANIIDASGKLIPVKNTGNEINVEALTEGTYIIQLQDKDGNVHSDKIIKK